MKLGCLGLLLVSASGGMMSGQKLSFAPGVSYPVGDEPQQAVIADLNGDGIPDIAVNNFASNTISIYLGRGDGTFVAGPPAAVTTPQWFAVADLNGDGIPDLVVSPGFSSQISLLFGNGDGTFRPPVLVAAGENASGVAVGDLNGDGKPDLVVANAVLTTTRGYLTILFNQGDGTFGPPVHIVAGHIPVFVKIAEFDKGRLPDIVVLNLGLQVSGMEGSVGILRNRGGGNFDPPKYYAAGHSPEGMVVSDFNRDGRLDIAVATQDSGQHGSVAVLLGNGDGSFQAPSFYPAGNSPFKLAAADFNGDGNPDLAVADIGGAGSLAVLLGIGDGAFQPPQYVQQGVFTNGIAAGDLNGDSKPDIVGVNFDLLSMTVFMNTTKFH